MPLNIRKSERENTPDQIHFRYQLNGKSYSGSTGLTVPADAPRKPKSIVKTTHPTWIAAFKAELAHRETKIAEHTADAVARAAADAKTTRPTFSYATDQWITWARADKDKQSTVDRYVNTRNAFAAFLTKFNLGDIAVDTIDAALLERFKTHRRSKDGSGVQDVTVRHDLHNLNQFIKYAIGQRWMTREHLIIGGNNIPGNVSIPSDKNSRREFVVTEEQAGAYFEAAYNVVDRRGRRNLHDVTVIMKKQGMRPEEVRFLRKVDVDFQTMRIRVGEAVDPKSREGNRVGKTANAHRTLKMSPRTAEILQARLAGPSQWFFPGTDAELPIKDNTLNSAHVDVRTALGYGSEFVVYTFRHTFATRAIEAGMPIPMLQKIMGHANIKTTMKYVHVDQSAVDAAYDAAEAAMERQALKVVNG